MSESTCHFCGAWVERPSCPACIVAWIRGAMADVSVCASEENDR